MGARNRVNILLVDDQPGKLLSYEAILGGLDENLIKANSAREALEQLLKNEIAVILIDVCMPELDGFDLVTLIREHPRYRNTAILLVSAVLMTDPDRLKGYDAGALDYVTVPIIPEVLRAKVKVCVELYRRGRELQALNEDLEQRVAERTLLLEASNEDLRRSEERYRLAAEALLGGISDWDIPGGTVRRSSGLLALIGYQPGEAPPDAGWWAQHIHPDDRGAREEVIDHALESEARTYRVEYRVCHRDGRLVWLCEQGCIVRDDSGRAQRVVRHMTDITTQREAEESLKDADRRKDQFLATLAHELRNPLAPIRNVVGLLYQNGLPEGEFEWCREVISRQVTHLTRLVDDLIDVSRITRDKLELQTERLNLADILQDAVEAARPLIEERGLQLVVSPPVRPIHVEGDRVRLTQVVMNLLNNAAKFTPRGGTVRLIAELVRRHPTKWGDRHAMWAQIRVIDNGIGIDQDKLKRLFDMFYQVSTSLDEAQGGLGVGLTLVKRLVDLHGGEVDATSPGAGKGSEFIVRLPPAAGKCDHADEGAAIPLSEHTGRGSRRILVADDNLDAVETLAVLLRRGGLDVHTAHDGVQALEVAERVRPDVVLLDIGMPGLSGYDVARGIRGTSWGKTVYLIALTGWGQEEDRRLAREAGFDVHVVKPVPLETLINLLTSSVEPSSSVEPCRDAQAVRPDELPQRDAARITGRP